MELLSYLLDEYPDEVAGELKALASSLIEAMGAVLMRRRQIVSFGSRRLFLMLNGGSM